MLQLIKRLTMSAKKVINCQSRGYIFGVLVQFRTPPPKTEHPPFPKRLIINHSHHGIILVF